MNQKIGLTILGYCVLFFLGSHIGFKSELRRSLQADQGFVLALIVVAIAASATTYFQTRRRGESAPGIARAGLIAPFLATAVATAILFVYFWPFDLDDKWVYYRISRSVLETGLPLWNPTDRMFVGASFAYPYFLAPGHWLGDWDVWEAYEKVLGILMHAALAALLLWHFRFTPLGLVVTAATTLFVPALLWALGGLDTTLASLWLVGAVLLYLRSARGASAFWVLTGCLMWIRPDAILVGVGTFAFLVLLEPKDLKAHFRRGLLFSAPIIAYFAVNYGFSGRLLPTVFDVKGWNKAFSGKYPLYYDSFIGGSHLLSAILCSVAITAVLVVVLAATIGAARAKSISFVDHVRERSVHYSLLAGMAAYLGYHVMGGYQHMNFTFRYWIPGIIGAFVVCADMLRSMDTTFTNTLRGRVAASLKSPFGASVLVSALIVQVALVACYMKHINITPTFSRLRDSFSVVSYAGYIHDWRTAGEYLRTIVGPKDKVYLYAMAPGAFTTAYLVDQYYFSPYHSRFSDLVACLPQPPHFNNCMIYYDYIVANSPETFPPSHEVVKEFPTLSILRRKELGAPSKPVLLTAKRNTPTTAVLMWQGIQNEYSYDVEVKNGDGGFVRVASLPAGYTSHVLYVADKHRVKVRVRSSNPNGVSEPSNVLNVELYAGLRAGS